MPDTLLVFSHLRWNFVYQRPQHVLSRFAGRWRIIYFEEPVFDEGEPFLETSRVVENVLVCRPHTPIRASGFHDDQIPLLRELLLELVRRERLRDYSLWFYTPMALPLASELRPDVIVYDCMDELSAFLNAPRQLLQRENALLKMASVVFTGGPSLYAAKRSRHPAVYCFPSSVDRVHFARALSGGEEHASQSKLPRPRLGFYGVIDERLDLQLLAALAGAHPEWQLVMVGPVAKVHPAKLPNAPNIHYMGQQRYEDLPSLLSGWDVCLMPFQLNAATRFISPTKVLEYMAAERPIVSTPIADVVQPYSEIVHIADGHAAFISACEQALASDDAERARRAAAMRETVGRTSWDRTVQEMHRIITEAKGFSRPAPSITLEAHADRAQASAPVGVPREYPVIVIGAGPTGLSAAYHLGANTLLLEQNERVGGWCRSLTDHGFTFDYAGHIMFSNDPYVHDLYRRLLGDNVHWQDREAWIYSKNVYTRYPFQGALYGLPPDVLKDCLIGAIEARFGPLKAQRTRTDSSAPANAGSSPSAVKAESITDCCADGITEAQVPLAAAPVSEERPLGEPRNFEEFIYSVWGAGVARHFAIPYNRKLWAVPLDEMETSWLGGRVPMPDLEEMIEGALRPVPKPMGPNARFGYPLKGGFQALMDAFLPWLQGELRLNAKVVRIVPSDREVVLADGSSFTYRQLVSTMPLPTLIRMMGHEAPHEVREAVRRLRHVSVRCVNLGVGRENLTEKHWIYYPEDTVFHRIFVQGNASPHCNPPGGFGLTCEITYSPHKPLPCEGEDLIDRCIADCIRVGLFGPDDRILARNQIDMPYAYVVYDHARKANVRIIRDWLATQGIILAGRYSEWEYYNSDHAFLAGRRAAEDARRGLAELAVPSAHTGERPAARGSAPLS